MHTHLHKYSLRKEAEHLEKQLIVYQQKDDHKKKRRRSKKEEDFKKDGLSGGVVAPGEGRRRDDDDDDDGDSSTASSDNGRPTITRLTGVPIAWRHIGGERDEWENGQEVCMYVRLYRLCYMYYRVLYRLKSKRT